MQQQQYEFSVALINLAERAAVVATTMAGLVPTAGTVQHQAQQLVMQIGALRVQLADWVEKDPLGPAVLDATAELKGEVVALKAEADAAKDGLIAANVQIAALKADLDMVKSKMIESLPRT